jgi:hypothetical protein
MVTEQPTAPPEDWRFLLLNGKNNHLAVLNPKFEKGELVSIEGLRPFQKKDDNGNEIPPTLEDAKAIKRNIYSEFFKKSFKNLLVLTGAGSSIDVGGPLMATLWNKVEAHYKVEDVDGFEIIRKEVKYKNDKQDLEALLSQIDGLSKFSGDFEITINRHCFKLSKIKNTIFDIIKHACSLPKPTTSYPHKVFLEKLLQRKPTSPRVKLFTLNYDLMFEYAATDVNAIVIDGFSFTYPREFSGRLFDYDIVQREGSKLQEEDNFIQRVFHLHKLHGSLNWHRELGKVIILDEAEKPLIVYPREAKYEDSYEQPFFEMMARFQRSLRINNDTLLICIGYSFNDKHINAAIEEALNQNPGFRLAIVNPQFDSDYTSISLKKIKYEAENSERIIMISERFTDFAKYFPEIQTYGTDHHAPINLKNDQS